MEFYVAHELGRLQRGFAHPTLGPRQSDDDGYEELSALVQLGLRPAHRVVDFGCGSLRLGRHLIRFLESGRYLGLDVTDSFYMAGVAALPSGLLDIKRPELQRISPSALERARQFEPDLVLVEGVLQCVPPRAIPRLMRQLAFMAAERTQIIVSFLEADVSLQYGRIAFRHAKSDLVCAATAAGLKAAVLREGLEPSALRGELDGRPISPEIAARMRQSGLSREVLAAIDSPELGRLRGTVLLFTLAHSRLGAGVLSV